MKRDAGATPPRDLGSRVCVKSPVKPSSSVPALGLMSEKGAGSAGRCAEARRRDWRRARRRSRSRPTGARAHAPCSHCSVAHGRGGVTVTAGSVTVTTGSVTVTAGSVTVTA